jgi:hypothetical protein
MLSALPFNHNYITNNMLSVSVENSKVIQMRKTYLVMTRIQWHSATFLPVSGDWCGELSAFVRSVYCFSRSSEFSPFFTTPPFVACSGLSEIIV